MPSFPTRPRSSHVTGLPHSSTVDHRMSVYRKLSTVLTVLCLLYTGLVGVIQLSLQPKVTKNQRPPGVEVEGSGGRRGGDDSIEDFLRIRGTKELEVKSERETDHAYARREENSQSILLRKLSEERGFPRPPDADHRRTLEKNVPPLQSGSSVTTVEFLPLGDHAFVYDAFLDNRTASASPYIHVFVMSPTRDHRELRQEAASLRNLVCRFRNGAAGQVVKVRAHEYEMCENHSKRFGGWIYSCPLPPNLGFEPETVSLASLAEDGTTQAQLDDIKLKRVTAAGGSEVSAPYVQARGKFTSRKNIVDRRRKNAKGVQVQTDDKQAVANHTNLKIAVCVPPLYGNLYVSRIINFLEMCRLLGAERINMYLQDISSELRVFLRHYADRTGDFLSLLEWKIPMVKASSSSRSSPSSSSTGFASPSSVRLPPSEIIWNRGQLLAIQHCLYNNMAAFDWLLFMDIDEMLVPQRANTWPELVRDVLSASPPDSRERMAAISFQSAFFQQDFQTQATNSIDYFQYLHRTLSPSAKRAKLLVRPPLVFELGIHHLSKPVSEELHVVRAPPQTALLHHYRKCVPASRGEEDGGGTEETEVECEILVKDETILKYEAELTLASRRAYQEAMRLYAKQVW